MSVVGGQCSILIPVHGEAELALQCLQSIAACEDAAGAQVIVIDDASPASDRERLDGFDGQAEIIHRATRGGFAAAVLTGLKASSKERPFVAILNSDVEVEPGWLSHLVEALDANAQLGAVAPCVLDQATPPRIDSAGLAYTLCGWSFRRGHGRAMEAQWKEPARVFGVTGTAALLRRRALDDIGRPFPEDFDGYYEDVTLSFRLQERNWQCMYVPTSVVHHRGSATYAKIPKRKSYCVSRNLEFVFWTHIPSRFMLGALPRHVFFLLAHAGQALLRGSLIAHCRGKLHALRGIGRIRSARRQRQSEASFLADRRATTSLRSSVAWILGAKSQSE